MKQWFKKWLKITSKSKAMILSMILAMLGVVEMNLHLFYMALGDWYGITYILVGILVAWIRILTSESLEDKE